MSWVAWTSAVSGVVLVAALAMAVMGGLAYRRSRQPRFLAVTLAFSVLLARAAWTIQAMFVGQPWERIVGVAMGGDALMLVLLYFAAVR